ncbi:MAG: YqgE/AlgH family protein [Bacteroides sp.]|nr:YqgE/AlgH family protein [Bacteroides sp.]
MHSNTDIFKIETNHVVPTRGKLLISEPFLRDCMFGRSVILLIDHTDSGSMGLVLNKPYPLFLNDILKGFNHLENIPVYKGGPLSTDTLFYLHTIPDIPGALPISKGFYLNGDFEAIKQYILQGNPVKGRIRFFLGYSGWECDQLYREITENTWLIGKERVKILMNLDRIEELWKHVLGKLGSKYELWSRFPQVPTFN